MTRPAGLDARLQAGISEIEQSLGRELTPAQRAELSAMVWEPGDESPAYELLPGREREQLFGADHPLVTADEMKTIFNLCPATQHLFWAFMDAQSPGSPLVALYNQLLRAARRIPRSVSASPYGYQPPSLYVAAVGPSGSGKTAAASFEIWEEWGDELGVPPAGLPLDIDLPQGASTPQGLYRLLRAPSEQEKEASSALQLPGEWAPAVHMEFDELSQDLSSGATATGHAGGMFQALSSAWSSKPFVRSTGLEKREIPARFTLTILAGLQPSVAAPLLATAGQGFYQRWVAVPAMGHLQYLMDTRDIQRPQKEAHPLSVKYGTMTHVTWCESMHREHARIKRLATRPARSEAQQKQAHRFPLRFRLAAAGARLEGKTAVSEETWAWAGVLLAVSERTLSWVERAVAEGARAGARERGQLLGETRAAAAASEKVAAAGARALVVETLEQNPAGMTQRELLREITASKRELATAELASLVELGEVTSETLIAGNGKPKTVFRLA